MSETPDSGRLRSWIAVATLLAVVALSWDRWLTVVAGGGRAERIEALEHAADSLDPAFVRFVESVGRKADPGQQILIAVPPSLPRRDWYLYRAEWLLAGRRVTPLFELQREPDRNDLLLFWKLEPNLDRLELLMRDGDGSLLRVR